MNKNILRWAAAPVGLTASAAVVLGFSSAAFTSTQTNADNSFATHDNVALQLTDGANSALATLPLFDADAAHLNGKAADGVLKPDDTISNSITVNYTGRDAARVALTSTGASSALADDLLVTVRNADTSAVIGTADQPLSALNVPVLWDVAGSAGTQSQKYLVTVKLDPTTTEYDATLNGVGFAFTATAR
ncbi:hypothetical protein ACIBSW_23705 [Actinoplanes sp. NPDC049668]|uniref:hypothetical protein n=1 Tax=unclassified Actinoplanes TaxID=2626549 RepID=UPI0033B413FC